MKVLHQFLFVVCLSFLFTNAFAQAHFEVAGSVVNEKGEPIKGATVFIGGSEFVTATGDDGRFRFSDILQGTYQLSVHMLGFAPLTRNIIVKDGPLNIDLKITPKAISLDMVQIGKNAWASNFKLFSQNFLGTSANAKECVIVNPKVISFSTKKGLLLAEAEDFLIIENNRLGYRLFYQLEDFGYSLTDDIALYHGQYRFEEMKGTEKDQKTWAKNRLATYQGSFMHFLRSVYANNVLENGFITRPMYGYGRQRLNPDVEDKDKIVLNDRQVMFDTLVASIDTSFKSLKFRQLYITYEPQKATSYFSKNVDKPKTIIVDSYASILRLGFGQATIDKKGSYTDYRDFFIHGDWARDRVADQLPVNYNPPFVSIAPKSYPTDGLAASLQHWVDSIPQEKVYLHMDKPCYAPGDTIWFKGYLTAGSRHDLSNISGAVYVDLLNHQNKPVNTLKLPVGAGMIAGNFILDDSLKDGTYRIRAYTRWMRNAGEDYFFNQTFNIGNPPNIDKQKGADPGLQQTDIQFFPESGNLVNGLPTRVAFKAIGVNGFGIPISGKITDSENNTVADLITANAGMGSFLLKPMPGKTYNANVNFTDGTSKTIELPKAAESGYVLNVYQPNKDSILIRIRASANLQKTTVYLVAQSSGEMITVLPVAVDGPMSSTWLEKRQFPSGIAQFTIFNANSEPLNERIIFIKADDKMKLNVKADKPVYKSKELVQLSLETRDGLENPIPGYFSVSVIDASKVPVDESAESTIYSNILLKSDLKGYIEKPNYYFTADTEAVNTALDNLMLTQGYRRFEWKQLDSLAKTKPVYAAEGLGAHIAGLVTTLTHIPVSNAKIKIASIRAGFVRDTVADVNGRFNFDKILIGDSLKFAVQARDADGGDKVILVLDSLPQITLDNDKNANRKNTNDVLPVALRQNTEAEGQSMVHLTGEHLLKQVNIKIQKTVGKRDVEVQGIFSVLEASADQVLTIPDPDRYNNLEQFMQGNLHGVHIEVDERGYHVLIGARPSNNLLNTTSQTSPNAGREVRLILNGRMLSADEADEVLEGRILPQDVAKIEVVRTNQALLNSLRQGNDPSPPQGYVMILTKPAGSRTQYNPGIVNISPKGFNKVRHFYSPRYTTTLSSEQPDHRTTIYWNPYLNVDESGKAKFDFYNASGPATYRVVVEGISTMGNLGRQVFVYKVE